MIRTDDTADAKTLRELFDMEPGDELADTIAVCAGEWRREGDVWRFFSDPEFDA